jgi:4-aminobutyrate aminotransferase-like enzyme/Ser/Thr protein kinase RdoA (MazF antagonist)
MSLSATATRRALAPADAAAVLRHLYGLGGKAQELAGELDQNFLMTVGDRGYVLKIYRTDAERDVLDLQDAALRHVLARDGSMAVPRPIADREGATISTITAPDGTIRFVRLLDWLPGTLMGEFRPYSAALLRSLGGFLGRLDRALGDFRHPAEERKHLWAMTSALEHRALLKHIGDPDKRAVAAAALDAYERHVLPVLARLPRQIIHHDANEWNVVVGSNGACAGFIDFGDMTMGPRIAEVAVACAYGMMAEADPIAAMATVVGGYNDENPLTELELSLLLDLVRTRLAQSVCMSAWQSTREPDNDYLLISQKDAWALLTRLAEISPRFVHYALRAACGLPPHPAGPRIANFLAARADSIGPVCRHNLTKAPVLIFDWTEGSADLMELEALPDMAARTAHIEARLAAAGASAGIGRYREPRPVYRGPLFETASGERREIHLGLDVFLPADEPIFSPLDAVVHAVHDNAGEGDYGPVVILEHRTDQGDSFHTLYGHLSLETLDLLKPGDEVVAGQHIGWIGLPPHNGNWVPHLHLQLILDLLDRGTDIEGVAAASAIDLWEALCPNPNIILGIPAAVDVRIPRSKDRLLEERRTHLGRSLSISYAEPLKIVRGRGQFLIDESGEAYLDMVNNVAHVGHCHPRVVAAGQAQMAELNTNTRYLHDNIVELARRLTATLPTPLSVCFFVNSGSEANDLALRLARTYTGRRDVVSVAVGYHGNLTSLIEISPYKFDGPGGTGRPPGCRVAEMPDGYRGRLKYGAPELGPRYAEDVARQIAAAAAEERQIAAFFCESILSCGGQIVLPPGYLAAAYDSVRAAGGVCVADEVQVGFGRVGTHMWGFETQGVIPDIVTMGKPFGNGHPLGAVVTTPEVAAAFANGMEYFNTFGGNPVSAAIGLAVLDVIADQRLQSHARVVGERMLAGLMALQQRHPLIGDVRGLGLFVGFELVRDRETLAPAPAEAKRLVEAMKRRRILLSIDGALHNVIKIKPPLVFDSKDCDRFLSALDEVLSEMSDRPASG